MLIRRNQYRDPGGIPTNQTSKSSQIFFLKPAHPPWQLSFLPPPELFFVCLLFHYFFILLTPPPPPLPRSASCTVRARYAVLLLLSKRKPLRGLLRGSRARRKRLFGDVFKTLTAWVAKRALGNSRWDLLLRKLLHGYLLRWWRSSGDVAWGRSLLALGRHAGKTGVHKLLICRVGSVFAPI